MTDMNANTVADELLKAIDIIVSKRIEGLPYDQTRVCTIINADRARNGEYLVTDGSINFYAKCENTNYVVNDQVRVSIPNGDFTNEKFIVGKYVTEDSNIPITYAEPLSDIVITNAITVVEDSNLEASVQAHSNGAKTLVQIGSGETIPDVCNGAAYNILYVKADFKTLLDNFTLTNGTYGLILAVTTDLGNEKSVISYYDFNSSQMLGDPYAFKIYTTQAAKFDISELPGKITSIKLQLYQDGMFQGLPNDRNEDMKDIFIQNIQVGFGFDATKIPNKTVKIFTTQSDHYSKSDNERTIHLAWFNRDENGNYDKLAGEGEEGSKKDVYKDEDEYQATLPKADSTNDTTNPAEESSELAAASTENAIEDAGNTAETKTNENEYCIYWYRRSRTGNGDSFMPKGWERIEITEKENQYIVVTLDAEKSTREEFKVLVFFNHVRYESSNSLIFDNDSAIINEAVQNAISSRIEIIHGANSRDIYADYTASNLLINSTDSQTEREIKVQFINSETGKVDYESLIGTKISWHIPVGNSTLLSPGTNAGLTKGNSSKGDNYKCYSRKITEPSDKESIQSQLIFQYKIKNIYSAATNNTIYCEINKGETVYTADIKFTFANYGTSGSEYTLIVEPVEGQSPAITNENSTNSEQLSTNPWQLSIRLYNKRNELVTFSKPQVDLLLSNSAYKFQSNDDPVSTTNEGKEWICKLQYDDNSSSLCNVLKVTIPSPDQAPSSDKNLITYFPIPYSSSTTAYIEGATSIIYDSFGTNPVYYKDAYKLFEKGKENSNCSWSKVVFNEPESEVILSEESSFIQSCIPDLTDDNKLSPAPMYIDNIDITSDSTEKKYCICIQCREDESDTVLWSQPIVIIQNRYSVPTINSWDGEARIDTGNNTIFSAMMGAGSKDSENQFSGVLMGSVGEKSSEATPMVGLFGFRNGAQSFGFKVDGTAFIGESGRGQLRFDGTESTIKSASYDDINSNTGMCLDFDNGFIDIKGRKEKSIAITSEEDFIQKQKTYSKLFIKDANQKLISVTSFVGVGNYWYIQSRVRIDAANPYFKITSADGNPLINIGNDDYYLQSDNYDNDEKTGVRIDLSNGNFNLRGPNNSEMVMNNEDYYLESGNYNADAGTGVNINLQNGYLNLYGASGAQFIVNQDNYYLQSGKYQADQAGPDGNGIRPAGMKIDINKGVIDMWSQGSGNSLCGNHIQLSTSIDTITEKANPLMLISAEGNRPLMVIGGKEEGWKYFIQSENYSDMDKTGTKISLENGSIISYGFTLTASQQDTSNSIILNSVDTDTPFKVGEKFSVNWDGSISASGGTIGGFTIGYADQSSKQFYDCLYAEYRDENGTALITGMQPPDDKTSIAFTVGATDQMHWDTGKFYVTHEGFIHAQSGQIGSWSIAEGLCDDIDNPQVYLDPTAPDAWILNGYKTDIVLRAGNNFGVSKNGKLYAGSGEIGGWIVSNNSLISSNGSIRAGAQKTYTYGADGRPQQTIIMYPFYWNADNNSLDVIVNKMATKWTEQDEKQESEAWGFSTGVEAKDFYRGITQSFIAETNRGQFKLTFCNGLLVGYGQS